MHLVWEEVKKVEKVSEAIKCVANKHKELAAAIPGGTIDYQYSCIVARRLMNVMEQAIKANLFKEGVLQEVQKYITDYARVAAANPCQYAFGTLKNPQRFQLFSGSGSESEEDSASDTETLSDDSIPGAKRVALGYGRDD